MKLNDIAENVIRQAAHRPRFIVAIAGPPGAGKSTLAEKLQETLRIRSQTAEILPMDGFHMDNGILEARGLLPRKGAPETFDVRGFADTLRAVRDAQEEVLVPVFDRSREIAIASARAIAADTRFVLAEGNYLLIDGPPWSRLKDLFDFTIFVGPDEDVLRERLLARWIHYGLDQAAIDWKLNGNDLPNGRYVIAHSRAADIRLEEF